MEILTDWCLFFSPVDVYWTCDIFELHSEYNKKNLKDCENSEKYIDSWYNRYMVKAITESRIANLTSELLFERHQNYIEDGNPDVYDTYDSDVESIQAMVKTAVWHEWNADDIRAYVGLSEYVNPSIATDIAVTAMAAINAKYQWNGEKLIESRYNRDMATNKVEANREAAVNNVVATLLIERHENYVDEGHDDDYEGRDDDAEAITEMAESLLRKDWTEIDVHRYIRLTAHVNPSISEDIAIELMESIEAKYTKAT